MNELSDRELASVLAGLRLLQLYRVRRIPVAATIVDISTNNGEHAALSLGEIDALCMRLNSETVDPPYEDIDTLVQHIWEREKDDYAEQDNDDARDNHIFVVIKRIAKWLAECPKSEEEIVAMKKRRRNQKKLIAVLRKQL